MILVKKFLKKIIRRTYLCSRKLYYFLKSFCTKYNIIDQTYTSFLDYEKLVDEIHEKPKDLVIGKISKELLSDLKLNFCNDVSFLNSERILDTHK